MAGALIEAAFVEDERLRSLSRRQQEDGPTEKEILEKRSLGFSMLPTNRPSYKSGSNNNDEALRSLDAGRTFIKDAPPRIDLISKLNDPLDKLPHLSLFAMCAMVLVQASVWVLLMVVLLLASSNSSSHQTRGPEPEDSTGTTKEHQKRYSALQTSLDGKLVSLRVENNKLHADNRRWRERIQRRLRVDNPHPYRLLANASAHDAPKMYGQVREKTIWSYWYHPTTCASSSACILPDVIQLCRESIELNKGDFDFKLLHLDNIVDYVGLYELPVRWYQLEFAQQRDALMNALLARYGGVALHLPIILLRPLDNKWNEMIWEDATFRGFMFRTNGHPWSRAQTMATWFLMSRREGIFTHVVSQQILGMGDMNDTNMYKDPKAALGDQALTPVLGLLNFSLPRCIDDNTVTNPWPPYDELHKVCPEYAGPLWYKEQLGEAKTDAKVLLEDPRDGPLLPFSELGMELWDVHDVASLPRRAPSQSAYLPLTSHGGPMYNVRCNSTRSCWRNVVLPRFDPKALGRVSSSEFVVLSADTSRLLQMKRQTLIQNQSTYLYHWLRMAGVVSG